MFKIAATISTKGRYETTLPMAMLSVALQTHKPDKLIIFDDNDSPQDLRNNPLYFHLFRLLDEKGITWEVRIGCKKGQHYNHQLANKMDYDFIWRLDDDEFAEENVLEGLLKYMTGKNIGAVGGLVLVPSMALEPMPEGTDNKIEKFFSHPNLQWFRLDSEKTYLSVDHLTSSFLYRPNIADYNLNLSRVGHTEETQFTYELKRKGYFILINPKVRTWHFRQPQGGIRSGTDESLWKHDEQVFVEKYKEWGLPIVEVKMVYLDNGIGDHIVFKEILPELKEIFKDITIACCYPEVFENEGVNIISIAEGKTKIDSPDMFNVYKWMWDHNWKEEMVGAFRKMYL